MVGRLYLLNGDASGDLLSVLSDQSLKLQENSLYNAKLQKRVIRQQPTETVEPKDGSPVSAEQEPPSRS